MTIMNMGTGSDLIGLDTDQSSTISSNAFDTNGALTNNTNIKAVANSAARTSTNFGQGGFVYQSDTGGLYYSSTGDFSGGGVLIGTITTDGSTPWTYDFTKFLDV
jgi:hypothetical protein